MTVRDWRQLAGAWAGTAALELAIAAFVWYLPLAADLLRPLYVVALVPGLWGTWRWLRPRGTHDRRGDDRRRAARRTDAPDEADQADDAPDGWRDR